MMDNFSSDAFYKASTLFASLSTIFIIPLSIQYSKISSQDNLLFDLSADKCPLKKLNLYFPIFHFQIIKSQQYTKRYCSSFALELKTPNYHLTHFNNLKQFFFSSQKCQLNTINYNDAK